MTERTHPQSQEQKLNNKPFEIRAHHIFLFLDFDKFAPDVLAEAYANNMFRQYKSKEPHEQKYARDVLGDDLSQMHDVVNGVQSIYENFLKFKDNDPVEITVGKKDAFCNLCVIGKHCATINQGDYLGYDSGDGKKNVDTVKGDEKHIDLFINTAKKIHEIPPEKLVTTEEIAYFFDAEPQVVRRLHTTAGVVRQFLSPKEE